MPFRFPWCPFGELTRAGLFEEVESPSTTHRELHGHRAIFADRVASPSVAHSYIAYVGPLPPTPSRNNDTANDSHHWNSLSGRNENFAPHPFPAINIQYHSWGSNPNSSRSGSHIPSVGIASIPPGTVRSAQGEPDSSTRPRSFPHPLPFEHRLNPRTGSAFVSAIFPRHPGNSGRIHVSHAFHHQPPARPGLATPLFPGIRRGLPAIVPARVAHADYIFPPASSFGQNPREAESPMPSLFHALHQQHSSGIPFTARGSGWGSYHAPAASDPSYMSSSFRHR